MDKDFINIQEMAKIKFFIIYGSLHLSSKFLLLESFIDFIYHSFSRNQISIIFFHYSKKIHLQQILMKDFSQKSEIS